MESNSVFDLMNTFGGNNSLSEDMKEVSGLVTGYFRNKYLNRLRDVISEEVTRQKTNPSDDMRLLYALKPYAGEKGSEFMDNVIDACALAKSFNSLRGYFPRTENNVMAAGLKGPSVNPDGVYEIDEDCKRSLNTQSVQNGGGLILLLILIALLKN